MGMVISDRLVDILSMLFLSNMVLVCSTGTDLNRREA